MSWTGKHAQAKTLRVGDCFLTRSNNALEVLAIGKAEGDTENKISLTLKNKLSGKVRTSDWWKSTLVFKIEQAE